MGLIWKSRSKRNEIERDKNLHTSGIDKCRSRTSASFGGLPRRAAGRSAQRVASFGGSAEASKPEEERLLGIVFSFSYIVSHLNKPKDYF